MEGIFTGLVLCQTKQQWLHQTSSQAFINRNYWQEKCRLIDVTYALVWCSLRFLFWWSIPKKLSRYKLTSSPSGQLGVSRSDLCAMLFHNKGRDLLNQKVSHALISKRVIIFMATLRRYKLSLAWMFRRSIWSRKTSLSLGNTVLRSVVRDRGFGTKH